MKHTKLLSLLFIAPLLFSSCDNVGEDERYIELGKVEAKRTVILEEYTGQMCTNCPMGHEAASKLSEQYGERLIVVGIHGGPLSVSGPIGSFQGLANDESNSYYKKAGEPSLPAGVVNRTSGCIDRAEWADAVRREIEKETPAEMSLTASVDDNGTIHAEAIVLSSENLNARIQFWVIESGIVSYQLDNGQHKFDYVHNHVFRACMNGVDGDAVKISKDVYFPVSASLKASEEWNLDNVAVVAILSSDSQGAIQVAEASVAIE